MFYRHPRERGRNYCNTNFPTLFSRPFQPALLNYKRATLSPQLACETVRNSHFDKNALNFFGSKERACAYTLQIFEGGRLCLKITRRNIAHDASTLCKLKAQTAQEALLKEDRKGVAIGTFASCASATEQGGALTCS
jgi:hypothetical protein